MFLKEAATSITVMMLCSLVQAQSIQSRIMGHTHSQGAVVQIRPQKAFGHTFWGREQVYLEFDKTRFEGFAGGRGHTQMNCVGGVYDSLCTGLLGGLGVSLQIASETQGQDRLISMSGRFGKLDFLIQSNIYGSWIFKYPIPMILIHDGQGGFAGDYHDPFGNGFLNLDIKVSSVIAATIDPRLLFIFGFAPALYFAQSNERANPPDTYGDMEFMLNPLSKMSAQFSLCSSPHCVPRAK